MDGRGGHARTTARATRRQGAMDAWMGTGEKPVRASGVDAPSGQGGASTESGTTAPTGRANVARIRQGEYPLLPTAYTLIGIRHLCARTTQ